MMIFWFSSSQFLRQAGILSSVLSLVAFTEHKKYTLLLTAIAAAKFLDISILMGPFQFSVPG